MTACTIQKQHPLFHDQFYRQKKNAIEIPAARNDTNEVNYREIKSGYISK